MKKIILSCLFALTACGVTPCLAEDERFDVNRVQVDGNTLLPDAEVQRIVSRLTGKQRVYGDIQKTLEALEGAYRKAGYGTVQVFVPEQELTGGTVQLRVTEGIIGKVIISGNNYFSNENVRAGLPALKEGKTPNMRELSEVIQLSNESPAKQVEVTLGASEEENKVDAKVVVTEENPQRAYATFDTTGTEGNGRTRLGIAYQHANLFNRDHTLTLAYTGSPDQPTSVKVDVFSIGYRIPLYDLGDSVDFIYGKSNVNTPSATPTLGTDLGIAGKGDVIGLRYNYIFPRQGEYTSRLVFGLDYKYMNTRCVLFGQPANINPPTPTTASCVPYTSRPLSLTYSGQWQTPGQMLDFNVGLSQNWSLGTQYTNTTGTVDRYSYLTSGNRDTKDNFTILRYGGSYLKALEGDMQFRIAGSGQFTDKVMVAAEQFGLAGSTTVRGFSERAAASDWGYVVNAELYSPELSKAAGVPGSLRALIFYDFSRGFNHRTLGTTVAEKIGVASVGAGLRYNIGKDVSVRADLGIVLDDGPALTRTQGEFRGHLNMMIAF